MLLDVVSAFRQLMLLRVKEQRPRLVGFSFEDCKLFLCLDQVIFKAVGKAARYCEVMNTQNTSPDEVLVLFGNGCNAHWTVGIVVSEQLPVLVAELAEVPGCLVRPLRHGYNYYSD